MIRLTPGQRWRPVLFLIALLLLGYAVWGMARSYPDFDTLRSEPARIRIPAPDASATP